MVKMSDITGDLRRKVDFNEPSGQIQALALLFGEIEKALRKMGASQISSKNQNQFPEIRLLWDCVVSSYCKVSDAGCRLTTGLIHKKLLDPNFAHLHLVYLLTSAKHGEAIIECIGDLILDGFIESQPAHPFLACIRDRPDCSNAILAYLETRTAEADESIIRKLVIPIMAHWIAGDFNLAFSRDLMELLIDISNRRSELHFLQMNVMNAIVWSAGKDLPGFKKWIRSISQWEKFPQFENSFFFLEATETIIGPAKISLEMIFEITGRLYAAKNPSESRNCLYLMKNFLETTATPHSAFCALPSVMMVYSTLGDLAKLGYSEIDSTKELVKSCLQLIEKAALKSNDKLVDQDLRPNVLVSKRQLHGNLLRLLEDSVFCANWLRYCVSPSAAFSADSNCVDLFSGVLMKFSCEDSVGLALDALYKCALYTPQLSPYILPVILHRYSKAKSESAKEKLLRFIPRLATHRLVTPQILKFLLGLTKSRKYLAIELLGDLWKRQERIFPQIKEYLAVAPSEIDMELIAVKLRTIRLICLQSGSEFGEDLLPQITTVVNDRSESNEGGIVAIAIESLAHLCSDELMDFEIAWKQIWSKLRKDNRISVKVAMCKFLQLASDNEMEISDDTRTMAIKLLWSFVGREIEESEITGAALIALSNFNPEEFELGMLPDYVKQEIRIPASLISTPIDAAKKPEELMKYIPGSAYVTLLRNMGNKDSINGWTLLARRVIQRDVLKLGRSIHHVSRSRSQNLYTQSDIKPLFSICSEIVTMYLKGKAPFMKNVLAVGCLLAYEPKESVDIGKSEADAKKAMFQIGRGYLEVFSSLLKDVTCDTSDWLMLLTVIQGWKSFMRRAYDGLIKGRLGELEMTKVKSDQDEKRIETAWLWARDQLVEKIKQAAKEGGVSQANALLALGMLAIAVKEFETSSNEKAENYGQFVSPEQWYIIVVETLLSLVLPKRFQQGQQLIPLGTLSKPSAISCAMASLGTVYALPKVQSDVSSFLGRVDLELFRHFKGSLSENASFSSLCTLLSFGILSSQMEETVRAEGREYLIGSLERSSNSGNFLGLSVMCSLSSPSKTELSPAIVAELSEMKKLDRNSVNESAAKYSVALLGCVGMRDSTLDSELRAKIEKSLDDGGIEMAMLLSVFPAFATEQTSSEEFKKASDQLFVEISQSTNTKATQKSESIRFWCALLGSETLSLGSKGKQVTQTISRLVDKKKIQKLAAFLESALKNPEDNVLILTSALVNITKLCNVWSSTGESASCLPESYDYLPDWSVLSSLVKFLADAMEVDQDPKKIHAALSCMVGDFGERGLPPLRWDLILTPFLDGERHRDFQETLVSLGVQEKNPPLMSKLSSRGILETLSEDSLCLLLQRLTVIFQCAGTDAIENLYGEYRKRRKALPNTDNITESFWTGIRVLSETERSNLSISEKIRQWIADFFSSVKFTSYLASKNPELLGLKQYLSEFPENLGGDLTRIALETPLTAVWIRCCSLSALSQKNLYSTLAGLAEHEKLSAFCVLLDAFASFKLDEVKQQEWLLDWMNHCLLTIKQSHSDELLDSKSEVVLISLRVLACAVCSWCPFSLPLPLLTPVTVLDEQVSTEIHEAICDHLLMRLPFSLHSLLTSNVNWTAFSEKVIEWLFECFDNSLAPPAKWAIKDSLFQFRTEEVFKKILHKKPLNFTIELLMED